MTRERRPEDEIKDLYLDLASDCESRTLTGWTAQCEKKEEPDSCGPPCPIEDEILLTITEAHTEDEQ